MAGCRRVRRYGCTTLAAGEANDESAQDRRFLPAEAGLATSDVLRMDRHQGSPGLAITVANSRQQTSGWGRIGRVLMVRATKKLLRLTGPPTAGEDDRGTTLLGPWYATVLFWRPRVVLLVNESTLLPVLMPLAPAVSLTDRITDQVASVLAMHHVPAGIIDQECQHMRTCQLGTTANRSTVGVMIDLARLAEIHHDEEPDVDLIELAVRLARTPCSPLYNRHGSPDRELAANVHAMTT